jgi:PPOX class probable F420-dependent enzyme
VVLPDTAVERILDRHPVACLATLNPDGRPHVVPIVFARVGAMIWSAVDGKSKSSGMLARVRNIRRDPRVSLLLEHYEPDWTRLWWLRVDGEAEIRERSDAEAAAALTALSRKYPQYAEVAVLAPHGSILCIQPHDSRSWCASAAAIEALGAGAHG